MAESAAILSPLAAQSPLPAWERARVRAIPLTGSRRYGRGTARRARSGQSPDINPPSDSLPVREGEQAVILNLSKGGLGSPSCQPLADITLSLNPSPIEREGNTRALTTSLSHRGRGKRREPYGARTLWMSSCGVMRRVSVACISSKLMKLSGPTIGPESILPCSMRPSTIRQSSGVEP